MAATKISDMSTVSAVAGADELVIARSGANYKATFEQIKDAVASSSEIVEVVNSNTRWTVKTDGTHYSSIVPTIAITNASNATPVVITAANHGLKTGQRVHIAGVAGNTAANCVGDEMFYVDAQTIDLQDATNASPVVFSTYPVSHKLNPGDVVRIEGVSGNSGANNTTATPSWTVASTPSATTFTCTGCNGTGGYDGGGTVSFANKFKIRRLNNSTRVTITNVADNGSGLFRVTAASHGFQSFDRVIIQGCRSSSFDPANPGSPLYAVNNTGSNDTWQIIRVDANNFDLVGSTAAQTYSGGGTAELAFSNQLVDVAGNGAYTSGGTIKVPGQITLISSTTEAAANALGFYIGLPIRMKYTSYSGLVRKGNAPPKSITGITTGSPATLTVTAHGYSNGDYVQVYGVESEVAKINATWQVANATADTFELSGSQTTGTYTATTKTIYGLIASLPGVEGYPYTRDAVSPSNEANELTYAGPPILSTALTEVAVGTFDMVDGYVLDPDNHPYYGSESELPLSQLIQNSPSNIVDKWRMTGGGTVLGQYGDKYGRWMGGDAFIVAYSVVHREPASEGPFTQFSGSTVTITADSARPYNSDGQHTDGYPGTGSLVTRAAGTFSHGDPYTGLRGWVFRNDPATIDFDNTVVKEGGIGIEQLFEVTNATNATPIVVTVAENPGISDGCRMTIFGVGGNTNANATVHVNKLTSTTYELYSGTTFSISSTSNTTPIVVTTSAPHGLSNGNTVLIWGCGNTNANGKWVISSVGATTMTLDTSTAGGTLGGGSGSVAIAGSGAFTAYSNPKTITAATAASPIVVTSASHGFSNNDIVKIEGVVGNTQANGVWMVKNAAANTFELYDPIAGSDPQVGTVPYAGGGTVTKAGGFMRNGLTFAQLVLESQTMSASAGQAYRLDDVTQQPSINIDIGGQLLSPHDVYRGIRCHRLDNKLVFLPAVEINPESYDISFGSRLEIAATSMGNRPGVQDSDETGLGGAEFVTAFLVIVHK